MPKSRPNKPRGGQDGPPKEAQPSTLRRLWSAIIAVGSIGGLISLLQLGWSGLVVATRPEISAPLQGDGPFSLPFSIKNNSTLFSMIDTLWFCGIDEVKVNPITGLRDFSITYGSKVTIPPGGVMLGKCPLGMPNQIDATIVPIVTYRTWFVWREYRDKTFTWLPGTTPPRWVEGRPVR